MGLVPRRGGLIMSDLLSEPPKEVNTKEVKAESLGMGVKAAENVSQSLSSSHAVLDFNSFLSELQKMLPAGNEENQGELLPGGWRKVYSEEFRKDYYYHAEKRRSQWTSPQV